RHRRSGSASGADLDADVPARRRAARRAVGASDSGRRREPARRPLGGSTGVRSLAIRGGAGVTAVLAELEQPPLVVEVERVRALLEAFRDGVEVALEPAPEAEDGFEPAVDRLARVLGLSTFERQLLLVAAAVELDGDVAALVASLQ